MTFRFVAASLLLAVASTAMADGVYLDVTYPPSTEAGELPMGVT